jgi:tetratricopeptide (TPR) repeat protein
VNSLLMRSKSIDVIGFESATSARLKGLEVPAVAETLNVQYVLVGELSASGNSMRVSVRLLDAAGAALWSAVLDEAFDNLYALQERIATEVEARLGSGDDSIPVAQVAADRCWMPSEPEALEKYYRARYYIELRTETEESQRQVREAIEIYKKLIETYPEFAEAYAGLAWAYGHQAVYDRENAIPDWQEHSARIARQGVEHCPTLTEAIHHLPNEYDHPNPWIGAYQQLTAFVDMEPQRFENYQRLARHLRETGLLDRAADVAERNVALDPLSVRALKELASTRQQQGRLDEAIELFDLATELGSTGPNWARSVKKAYECGQDFDCRFRAWGIPDDIRNMLVDMTAPPADEAGVQGAIGIGMQLFEMNPHMFTNMLNATACHAEHLTSLFFEVRRASLEVSYWHWPNVWNHTCGNVWADPRFIDFVEEFGLPEYWRIAGWPAMCREDEGRVICG